MQFTATPRGARLARRLVSLRLDEWGFPYDTTPNEPMTLITAELTANAIRHGLVPGRDFRIRLTATTTAKPPTTTLRIEVTDARAEKRPPTEIPEPPSPDADSGRGLYLVSQLAERWGVTDRTGAPGKTVWAQLRV